MNLNLKQKILIVLLSLTLLSIIITSGVYYTLQMNDIRKLSQQQIRIALEMMFDETVSPYETICDWD